MPKVVRFDEYGGIDVLKVGEVEPPVPGTGEILVRVKAAGINPGEAAICQGAYESMWPAEFPSGQGSDLAGGVGSLAVQLAKNAGATVIGIASEANHGWLSDHGVTPVTYGEGQADRVREARHTRGKIVLEP